MNDSPGTLAESLYRQAQQLVPELRKRQPSAIKLQRLPNVTLSDLQAGGFFRILQPKRFGGYELDPEVFFRVQMILAQGCMSTAWVLGVVAIHNWQLALFHEQAQRDVWAEDNSTLISSSYMPVGNVTRVDGGFRLSGHWGFSSGSMHCQWAFLGAAIPPEDEGDSPDYRTFLVPREDYDIEENWDVSGLEGTGSHDIVVRDAFVPEYRTHRSIDGFHCNSPGNQVNTAPLYRIPFGQIFVRAVSSAAIGSLKGITGDYIAVNRHRVGLNDGNKIATDPEAQVALAQALAVVDECETIMFRNIRRMMAVATANSALPLEERIRMRYEAARVGARCADAVNDLFIACGAQGIHRSHPLNRAWLDINAGRTHVANNPFKFARNLGGSLMGQANTDSFL
ncbi:flavin-dependent monooxygenase [Parahaliea mediterranea]|uniref:flavin-dependent monooxygenase n=1 Tax=Parahaliea mediterranea TaxID=651086 RepID=UPI000E2EE120|nr:flavin-dependent monooxygenase [Parahaliea mediterranea]